MSFDPQYFTLVFFDKLVSLIKRKGFNFAFFGQDFKKTIYLRHDLDFSIDLAQTLALREYEKGVKATYFVMLETEAYNAVEEGDKLRDIITMGHDIGLHYVFGNSGKDQERLSFQANLLSDLIGRKVRVFSVHRPAACSKKGLDAAKLEAPSLLNAYSSDFFRAGQYISDSNHFWRSGNPQIFLDNFSHDMIQILIHPIWWTEKPLEREKKVMNFLENRDAGLKRYFRENVEFVDW